MDDVGLVELDDRARQSVAVSVLSVSAVTRFAMLGEKTKSNLEWCLSRVADPLDWAHANYRSRRG